MCVSACGNDPWPGVYANGEPFAECVAPVAEGCTRDPDRSFALAVCGDLIADNTLMVSGSNADVALWVRDGAVTHAPLTVAGDFWSASNSSTNTQSVSGSAMAGAAGPACSWQLTSQPRRDPRWDVRIDEPAEVTLEGCTYAQPSLEVNNTLTVRVHGDVAWFIESDLHIAAPLTVRLDPGAHLAWTITGALEVDNTLAIEGPTTLSVGGSIHVAAPFELSGSLVAPDSRVDVDNTLTISGAAYVGALHVAAPMLVRGETLLHENGCTFDAPGGDTP